MSLPVRFSKRNVVLALDVSAYMVLLTAVSIQ
jgi:hypothetical protein